MDARDDGLRGPGDSRFVGRVPELRELRRMWEGAGRGEGGLVLVTGEAGIGKTRLCEQTGRSARTSGLTVARAGCGPYDGAITFRPWTQLVQQLVQTHPQDAYEAGNLAIPLLGDPSPSRTARATADGEGAPARLRLFDGMATFLSRFAGRHPALLMIDDLPWADVPSLRLLSFLAPLLRRMPLLLVATYHEEGAREADALRSALPTLVPHARRVALGGLTAAETATLVTTTAVGTKVADGLAAAIRQHTGGNPLFAGELTRLLAGDGRLGALRTVSHPARLHAAGVPDTVRGVLGRRLDRLSPDCHRLLTLAATAGAEFGVDLLEMAGDLDRDRMLTLLAEAGAERLLVETGPDRHGFSHALVRATLYGELGVARRIRAHQRVGQALEALRERGHPVDPATLAHHFLAAAPGGSAAKAFRYAVEAGEQAMALLGHEVAAALFAQALATLDLDPAAGDRTRALLALGEARTAIGHPVTPPSGPGRP